MPSLLPDYEYDIFVSYRHNDNLDGWVTNFVKSLEKELRGTLKETLTIYFDKNPQDGLLETHHVDKSLEGKLKCLIFIPIISQTYCDPKSFAWQHEFVAFNKLSKEDQLGRDIKLSNSNVASRILPVKIHDLDAEDTSAIETEISGVLRAIEFIYKEPGVNRPLKTTDERGKNRSETDYTNQMNKVANAIKDMLSSLKSDNHAPTPQSLPRVQNEYFSTPAKSIAVLPFINLSNDPEQEYFSDGLTEEIITDLSKINQLLVISRSSVMTLKGTKKRIKEIASDVNVRYVLEGSVRKSGNKLRITAQLIDTENDSHLWADKFDGTLEDVFDIQETVSKSIVESLKVKLSQGEKRSMSTRPIPDAHAYECYFMARHEMYRGTKEGLRDTIKFIQNGIDMVGPNELLYASMGYASYWHFRFVDKLDQTYFEKLKEYTGKVFDLNPNSSHGHVLTGWINIAMGRLQEAVRSMKSALINDPNSSDALVGLAQVYVLAGKASEAKKISSKIAEMDPLSSFPYVMKGVSMILDGQAAEGLLYVEKGYDMDQQSPVNQWQLLSAYAWCGRNEDVFIMADRMAENAPNSPLTKQVLFLKYALQGKKEQALSYATKELEIEAEGDSHFAFHLAECYALVHENDKALYFLERAIEGFFSHDFLQNDPLFKNLLDEEKFKDLMRRAKDKSEAFEI